MYTSRHAVPASFPVKDPRHTMNHQSLCTRSTERRLRKMSQLYPPLSTFTFASHARVLCVGTAVVYRVGIDMTACTTCRATPPPSALEVRGRADGKTRHVWAIAITQSKLQEFYTYTNAVLSHCSRVEHNLRDEENTQVIPFIRKLAGVIRRYHHLRTAFEIHAPIDAMKQGTRQLEAFLGECWCALEILLPFLVVVSRQPTTLGQATMHLYGLVRDFLGLPREILQAHWVYANAVLNLRDADVVLHNCTADRTCSICLESLESRVRGKPTGLTVHSVSLSCKHTFHENCAMAWLRHNPSCPECRHYAGGLE